MPQLLWLLALVVTFGLGLAAGGARGPGQSGAPEAEDLRTTVSRLERHIGELEAQVRVREARVVALQERLAAAATVAAYAARPQAAAPPPEGAGPGAVAADGPVPRAAARAVGREDRPAPPPVPSAPRATPATVEAALEWFYGYLDATSGAGGQGRWRHGRGLLDELRAMGDVGVDALLHVLAGTGSSDERLAAATLLGSLQDPRALPLLRHIIETDGDLLLRRAAARSLRRLQVAESIPVLEALLASPAEDRFVRLSAALGLAQLGAPQGVTALARIFDETDADGRGRDVAFRALASLDDERALPFMRQLATSPAEVSYRLQAIRFMAAQRDAQALDVLRRVMESPAEQPSIRDAAAQAYAAITAR
jgi:hypothetical protein